MNPFSEAKPPERLKLRFPKRVGTSVQSSTSKTRKRIARALVLLLLVQLVSANVALAGEWQPTLHIDQRTGTDRSSISFRLMAPLTQEEDRMLFADLRGVFTNDPSREGNLGLGYRWIPEGGQGIYGVYGFADRRQTASGNLWDQITAGFEWIGLNTDVRFNAYFPRTAPQLMSSLVDDKILVSGTTLIYEDALLNTYEAALGGFDASITRRLTRLGGDTRVTLRGFHFTGDHVPPLTGANLRLETRIHDVLDIPGAQLIVGVEGQTDTLRGGQGFLTLGLSVPFGAGSVASGDKEDDLRARMMEPIQRDIDIVVAPSVRERVVESHSDPIDVVTGEKVTGILFIAASGQADAEGSPGHPLNVEGVNARLAEAYEEGIAGVLVIPVGSDDIHTGEGLFLMPGNILMSKGRLVFESSATGRQVTFARDEDATVLVNDDANPVIVVTQDNRIIGIETAGGQFSVFGQEVAGSFYFEGLNLADAALGAISLSTATGAALDFRLVDSAISGSGGVELVLEGPADTMVEIARSTIDVGGNGALWLWGGVAGDLSYVVTDSVITSEGTGVVLALEGVYGTFVSQFADSEITSRLGSTLSLAALEGVSISFENSSVTSLEEYVAVYAGSGAGVQFRAEGSSFEAAGEVVVGTYASNASTAISLTNSTVTAGDTLIIEAKAESDSAADSLGVTGIVQVAGGSLQAESDVALRALGSGGAVVLVGSLEDGDTSTSVTSAAGSVVFDVLSGEGRAGIGLLSTEVEAAEDIRLLAASEGEDGGIEVLVGALFEDAWPTSLHAGRNIEASLTGSDAGMYVAGSNLTAGESAWFNISASEGDGVFMSSASTVIAEAGVVDLAVTAGADAIIEIYGAGSPATYIAEQGINLQAAGVDAAWVIIEDEHVQVENGAFQATASAAGSAAVEISRTAMAVAGDVAMTVNAVEGEAAVSLQDNTVSSAEGQLVVQADGDSAVVALAGNDVSTAEYVDIYAAGYGDVELTLAGNTLMAEQDAAVVVALYSQQGPIDGSITGNTVRARQAEEGAEENQLGIGILVWAETEAEGEGAGGITFVAAGNDIEATGLSSPAGVDEYPVGLAVMAWTADGGIDVTVEDNQVTAGGTGIAVEGETSRGGVSITIADNTVTINEEDALYLSATTDGGNITARVLGNTLTGGGQGINADLDSAEGDIDFAVYENAANVGAWGLAVMLETGAGDVHFSVTDNTFTAGFYGIEAYVDAYGAWGVVDAEIARNIIETGGYGIGFDVSGGNSGGIFGLALDIEENLVRGVDGESPQAGILVWADSDDDAVFEIGLAANTMEVADLGIGVFTEVDSDGQVQVHVESNDVSGIGGQNPRYGILIEVDVDEEGEIRTAVYDNSVQADEVGIGVTNIIGYQGDIDISVADNHVGSHWDGVIVDAEVEGHGTIDIFVGYNDIESEWAPLSIQARGAADSFDEFEDLPEGEGSYHDPANGITCVDGWCTAEREGRIDIGVEGNVVVGNGGPMFNGAYGIYVDVIAEDVSDVSIMDNDVQVEGGSGITLRLTADYAGGVQIGYNELRVSKNGIVVGVDAPDAWLEIYENYIWALEKGLVVTADEWSDVRVDIWYNVFRAMEIAAVTLRALHGSELHFGMGGNEFLFIPLPEGAWVVKEEVGSGIIEFEPYW